MLLGHCTVGEIGVIDIFFILIYAHLSKNKYIFFEYA
jgi:hypothetical protein